MIVVVVVVVVFVVVIVITAVLIEVASLVVAENIHVIHVYIDGALLH